MLRAVLLGFFVASMFGMPAQSIAIVITFWVFVFWLTTEQQQLAAPQQPWSRPLMLAAAVLIGVHAGATVIDAFGELRPRERAQRFNWYYRYGYYTNDDNGYDLEPDPGGNPIGRRWTMKKSLAVIPVKGKILKFVAWVDHPDKTLGRFTRKCGRIPAGLRRRFCGNAAVPRHSRRRRAGRIW
jgi:hypothetical protein